jgi:hypothetical protein
VETAQIAAWAGDLFDALRHDEILQVEKQPRSDSLLYWLTIVEAGAASRRNLLDGCGARCVVPVRSLTASRCSGRGDTMHEIPACEILTVPRALLACSILDCSSL